jgi:hypothetical protein
MRGQYVLLISALEVEDEEENSKSGLVSMASLVYVI